jgi:integrase
MTDDSDTPRPVITRDNSYLSKVIQPGLRDGSDHNGARNLFDECIDPQVLEYLEAATASSTRRAYQSDLRHFLAWGGRIPTTPEQVARYLADHGSVLSMATHARRLLGIRAAHIMRRFPDPTKSELVRLTLRGIYRTHGRPQRRVAALSSEDLQKIIGSLGDSTRDIRDAAILLVGFAGAFRRSELIAIDRSDVDIGETRAFIVLRRSKTDQIGKGRTISIPRAVGPLCPVAALEHWLKVSEIKAGPIFRRVGKKGTILPTRISAEAVACLLKKRVQAIGHPPDQYSGHSLRSGFVTEAAKMGLLMWRIRRHTGHLSDSTLGRYIREGERDQAALSDSFPS